MYKFKILAATMGLMAMQLTIAEDSKPAEGASPFSANVSLTNNYLYRGIAQTGGKPAVQGGFDYEHPSGLYAGVFGTNSSFFNNLYIDQNGLQGATNASLEVDVYAGFKSHFAGDYNFDAGFLRYNYPGDYAQGAVSGDTNEIYAGLGYKWVSAKFSYSLGNTFGVKNARGTTYIEVNANVPLAEGLRLDLHAGKQTFEGPDAAGLAAAGLNPTYADYKAGLSKEMNGGYEASLAYSKTNAATGDGTFYHVLGRDLGMGATVLSITRTF